MQQVITAEQATQITGKSNGPLTLEQYERACELLQECTTIVQAKKWTDAASMWATAAKLKEDKRALMRARALLYQAALACREMAEEEAARRRLIKTKGAGSAPVNKVMMENGFSLAEARGTGALKRFAAEGRVGELISHTPPPSLTTIKSVSRGEEWSGGMRASSALSSLMVAAERTPPKVYVDGMRLHAAKKSIEKLEFLYEWIGDALGLAKRRFPS